MRAVDEKNDVVAGVLARMRHVVEGLEMADVRIGHELNDRSIGWNFERCIVRVERRNCRRDDMRDGNRRSQKFADV
jgi:hypothetical protein